jgi:hypothetical protein
MTISAKRPELGDLKPGDQVFIRRSSNDRRGRDRADVYYSATVEKASRVWITLTTEAGFQGRRFRRDDQSDGSQYLGSSESFVTAEQREWDEAVREAREFLKGQGIDTGTSRVAGWARGDRQIVLANAVRRLIEEGS